MRTKHLSLPAKLNMMVSKALIKTQLMNGCDPARAMERVNKQLCESNQQNMLVTAWLAVVELSTGRGLACNAGHENPAVCRAGSRFMIFRDKHDMSVGAFSMAKYHLREFELNPGDCLFVYTDGVPEATDVNGIIFRDDRLTRVLNENPAASPEELVTRLHGELTAFEDGTPQFDDITMLCLRYNGAGRLIVLNGPSSAGKSSIAAELCQQLIAAGRDPALLSIDDYMKIGTDEEIWEDDVFEIMPDMCRDLTAVLKEGRWVVVDHVVTSERIWQALLDAAEGCPVTSVQVTCSLETLKKREKERGNRFPGSAEASFRYLYPKEGYDLQINSEESTPQTSAETIKNYLLGNSQA